MAKAETSVETVTMDDGRVVEFTGKKKLIKTSIFGADGVVTIRLDWRNGETRTFPVPASLLLKFAAHGAEQKLGDEIAGVEAVEDCVQAVDELIERLNSGEFNQKREANGLNGASILAKALVKAYNKTPEAIRAFLSTKSAAEKSALRDSAKLRPIIAELEAEKASKRKNKVDTDQLLAGLDSIGDAETETAAQIQSEDSDAPKKAKKS